MNFTSLIIACAFFGFIGSFISLMISKFMAKMAYRIKVINPENPEGEDERWLVKTVQTLAHEANIAMPEVGIYDSSEANAFATGPTKNNSIVAVSSGLLSRMNRSETQGVLGHEVSHIANGDMVTMALLQGVLNTFVIFLSRVIGFVVDSAMSKDRDEDRGPGFGYLVTVIVCQIVLGVLASMIASWFSRHREFKADAGSASLCGKQPMIDGLTKLKQIVEGGVENDERSPALSAFKINGAASWLQLFSTHPPIDERIEALKKL